MNPHQQSRLQKDDFQKVLAKLTAAVIAPHQAAQNYWVKPLPALTCQSLINSMLSSDYLTRVPYQDDQVPVLVRVHAAGQRRTLTRHPQAN